MTRISKIAIAGAFALSLSWTVVACRYELTGGRAGAVALGDAGTKARGDAGAPGEEPSEAPPGLPDIPPPADLAAPPATAMKTASGVTTSVLTASKGGPNPLAYDAVALRYTGWTSDGKVFAAPGAEAESSPVVMRVEATFPGLAEAIQLMTPGEKRRVWIPSALGYDLEAQDDGAPAGKLVVDVELVDIVPTPAPPSVPSDYAAPPAGARRTSGGIAYRPIVAAHAKTRRAAASNVAVFNYTAWSSKGKLLRSSFPDARPRTEELGALDGHWSEALQQMKVGDTTRFWFPAKASSNDPAGDPGSEAFVADVELIYLYDLPELGKKR